MFSMGSFSPVRYLLGRAGRPLMSSGVQASSHLILWRQTLPIVKTFLKVIFGIKSKVTVREHPIFVGYVMKVALSKRLTSEAILKLKLTWNDCKKFDERTVKQLHGWTLKKLGRRTPLQLDERTLQQQLDEWTLYSSSTNKQPSSTMKRQGSSTDKYRSSSTNGQQNSSKNRRLPEKDHETDDALTVKPL